MDKRTNIDSLDANDVIGGKLISKDQNVNVYTGMTGKLIRTVPAGTEIGKIFSWATDTSGRVWFMLEDNGFVASAPGRFDETYLMNSLNEASNIKQAAIDKATDKRIEENMKNNSLYAFGKDPIGTAAETVGNLLGNLKWYLIGAIVLVLILEFRK